MVLKRITTRNLQSHKEVVVDLPPSGFIVFTGNNNNGKSVIGKTTLALLNGSIAKPRKRGSLVDRNSTFAEIEYLRDDGVRLLVHIQREAAGTYFRYYAQTGEMTERYLADKSYKELLQLFGWHYDENAEVSLQIAEADDALLFYKTSLKKNGFILETATTDPSAEIVLTRMTELLKESRNYRDVYTKQISALGENLRSLRIENVQPLRGKVERLEVIKRNLSVFHKPVLPEIRPVPKVNFVELYKPTLPKIRYPRIFTTHKAEIPNVMQLADEMEKLANMTCPTCGRRFVDDAC